MDYEIGEHGWPSSVIKQGEETSKDGFGLCAFGIGVDGFDLRKGDFLLGSFSTGVASRRLMDKPLVGHGRQLRAS